MFQRFYGSPTSLALLTTITLFGCGRSESIELVGTETGEDTFASSTAPTDPSASTNPTAPTSPTQSTASTEDPTLPGEECVIDQDCPIADPCEMAQCREGFCEYGPLDMDQDGFGPPQCGGPDCNDFNPSTFPGVPTTICSVTFCPRRRLNSSPLPPAATSGGHSIPSMVLLRR